MDLKEALKVVLENNVCIDDGEVYIPKIETFKQIATEYTTEQVSPNRKKLVAKLGNYTIFTVESAIKSEEIDYYLF